MKVVSPGGSGVRFRPKLTWNSKKKIEQWQKESKENLACLNATSNLVEIGLDRKHGGVQIPRWCPRIKRFAHDMRKWISFRRRRGRLRGDLPD